MSDEVYGLNRVGWQNDRLSETEICKLAASRDFAAGGLTSMRRQTVPRIGLS